MGSMFSLVAPSRLNVPGIGTFEDGYYDVSAQGAAKLVNVFMTANSYNYQRDLSKDHVKHLVREMGLGRYHPEASVGVTIAKATDTNLFMLLNGQHTLTAISKLSPGQTQKVRFTILEATERVLREVYGVIDTNRPRTLKVAAKALEYHTRHKLNVSQLNSTLAAVKQINNAYNGRLTDHYGPTREESRSLLDLLDIADLYGPDAKYFEDLTKGSEIYRVLKNAAVKAILMLILHEQPMQGRNFVRSVAFPGKVPGNNGALLHIALKNHLGRHASLSSWDMARSVILAWNAYFDSKHLHTLHISDEGEILVKGIRILGRPFSHQSRECKPKKKSKK